MDWVDSTEDTVEAASALRQAFEVIRPVPTQATARVQKVQTGKGKNKQQALLQGKLHPVSHLTSCSCISMHVKPVVACNAENLLQAFPPVFPEEPLEVRAVRQAAYTQCWSALSQHLEVRSGSSHASGARCPGMQ